MNTFFDSLKFLKLLPLLKQINLTFEKYKLCFGSLLKLKNRQKNHNYKSSNLEVVLQYIKRNFNLTKYSCRF